MVQRVYRGHLGRRKYKLRYDVIWAQKAEKFALILQAGYRGMKGLRAGHAPIAQTFAAIMMPVSPFIEWREVSDSMSVRPYCGAGIL
jgi:hypothetical protein